MGNKGFPLIVAFSVALHAVVLYGWTVSTFEPPVLDMLAGKMSVALAFELVPVEEPVEVVEEPVEEPVEVAEEPVEEPVEVVEEPVEEPVEVVEKPVKAVVKVAEPVEIKPAAASVPSIGISTDPSPLEDLNKPPRYPSKLGRRLHGETVLLEVQVLVDGSVGEIRMEKSSRYSLANKAVLKAVRKWQYRPAKRDGVAVEALHQERIVFEYRPGRSGSFGRD
jgi:protein TonB